LGDSLAQAVNQRLSLVSGLRAFVEGEIANRGLLLQNEFEPFASGLYNSAAGIRDIAVAPDGVMQYVFPFEENRSVLGYEPAKDSRTYVRAEVQRAIETRQIILSLPYELIQGGQGVIARQAIFFDDTYWGLANIVVDVPPLLENAGVVPAPEGLELALKDQSGNVFLGSEDVFAADPVTYSLSLPEGTWTLVGIPTGGWGTIYRYELLVYRLLVWFIIAAMTMVVYLFVNRQQRLTLRVEQRTREVSQQNIKLAQEIKERQRAESQRTAALDALQHRMRQLTALSRSSQIVTASLDLNQILSQIVSMASEVTASDYTSVVVLDKTGQVQQSTENLPDVPIIEYRIREDGLANWIITSRQPVIINEIAADGTISPDLGAGAPHIANPYIVETGIRSVAGLPLLVKDRLSGIIFLHSLQSGRFNDQLPVLTAFANQAAIAMENARMFEVEHTAREQAEILSRVAQTVGTSLNLNEILRQILKLLKSLLTYDTASILVIREGNLPELVVGIGYKDEQITSQEASGLLESSPILHRMARDLQPVVSGDVRQLDGWIWVPGAEHVRSWMGIPMLIHGCMTGALMIDSAQQDRFGETEIQLAQIMAQQTAQAIENARLYRESQQEIAERKRVEKALQQHTDQLEALRQASLSLTSNLALQPVLDAILKHALQLVTADDVHIFLYDGEKISFGSVYWVDGRQQEPFAEPRQNGLTYTVARSGERVVIPDMSAHPIFQSWPLEGAIVGLPLRHGEQVLGVMNVALDQPHEFTEGELRILELLADQAAVAIDNARLHEQVQLHAEELEQRVDERTQELRATQEQLVRREKLAVLGQLAGGISHDLRNPLAIINNAVFYLKLIHPDADEITTEYFDIIVQEVHNAEGIIADLLNFARTKTPTREWVAVSDLVAGVLQKHPPPITVQVITDVPTDLPPVFIDPRQITQAIGNLVDNAYQSMAEGGELSVFSFQSSVFSFQSSVSSVQSSVSSPSLSVLRDERSAVSGQRSVLVLRISDTGVGIPPENLDNLFEPLFTTKFKGIGLGLATSKHLIETNGGSIHAESEFGQGTTFIIQLPLADEVSIL
ncbi:MAG: GAF domain-containing protein, partial [Chloroflexi bacterium]|nr:GAF domain-containing protein [Chloroflexota bacterium]